MCKKNKKTSAEPQENGIWHSLIARCRKHYLALFICGTIAIFVCVLFIIYWLARLEQSPNISTTFAESADQWISLIGSTLSYAGTCFIGIIAMWQNKKLSIVNDKLLKIEELRIAPKFKCKPGSFNFCENSGTDSYIIVEHIGGECAYNLKIENLELSINGAEVLCYPQDLKIPSQIYIGNRLYYRFSLPFMLNPDDELFATITLRYSDSFGKTYCSLCNIPWKSLRAFAEDQNRSSKSNASNTEQIPVGATPPTGSTIH